MAPNNKMRALSIAVSCLYLSTSFASTTTTSTTTTTSPSHKLHHKLHHKAIPKKQLQHQHVTKTKIKTKTTTKTVVKARTKPKPKPITKPVVVTHNNIHYTAKPKVHHVWHHKKVAKVSSEVMNSNWFVGASYGSSWAYGLNHTSITNGSGAPAPFNGDYYQINSQPNNSSVWSVSGGYLWERYGVFFPRMSLALRYEHFNSFKYSGQVQQYSLPAFTNYNFNINAYSQSVMLLGKFELFDYHRFAPYVSAGLGGATNTFQFYNETALPGVLPRTSPAFQSNSTTNFAYSLGAGIDFIMTPNITVALGYEFNDLGKLQSGPGTAAWAGQTFSLGTLTTNTVSLNFFYQIPE